MTDRLHSHLTFENADSARRFLRMKPMPKDSGEDSEERLLGKSTYLAGVCGEGVSS